MLLQLFVAAFVWKPERWEVIALWMAVTTAIVGWTIRHDYRHVCYTLLSDAIELGRGTHATRIGFDEIESIVTGLPEKLHWIFRLQRFNPKSRGLHRNIVQARENTLLLRLHGDRYLPLNTSYASLANGRKFMTDFIELNRAKLVGRKTYTEREIAGLMLGKSNRLRTF